MRHNDHVPKPGKQLAPVADDLGDMLFDGGEANELLTSIDSAIYTLAIMRDRAASLRPQAEVERMHALTEASIRADLDRVADAMEADMDRLLVGQGADCTTTNVEPTIGPRDFARLAETARQLQQRAHLTEAIRAIESTLKKQWPTPAEIAARLVEKIRHAARLMWIERGAADEHARAFVAGLRVQPFFEEHAQRLADHLAKLSATFNAMRPGAKGGRYAGPSAADALAELLTAIGVEPINADTLKSRSRRARKRGR